MGSPDLPNNDQDRRRQFQPPPSHELPMHGLDEVEMQPQNPHQHSDDDADVDMEATQRNAVADASTYEAQDTYEADGYHPLNFEPISFGDDDEDEEDGSDDEGWTKAVDDGDDDVRSFIFEIWYNLFTLLTFPRTQFETVVPETEDEPPRNTVDRDILRQVWNQPRPAELNIDIDATKAEEVFMLISTAAILADCDFSVG